MAETSFARDAIALLLELAECGEIDPWDVQVVEAIDRHLRPLIPSEAIEAADEISNHAENRATGKSPYGADLSRSGQGFLYASMLLLLKADALVATETQADEPEPEPDAWIDLDDGDALPAQLEKTLRRRAVAPPPRKRPVTLQEMIDQIRVVEKTLLDRPVKPRRRLRQSSRQAARHIGQLAHSENLTETADDIALFLMENWPQLAGRDTWLRFDRLVAAWSPTAEAKEVQDAKAQGIDNREPPSTSHHHVSTFWALLLLASQSRVELQQAEFYGDIGIRPIDPVCDASAS
ncbi:MAG: segregation/condensation protein A [Geitlerinemataceae cyanobacterium]